MLHVIAILVLTGLHTHGVAVVVGFGKRSLSDLELSAEMRLVALVEGEERNEGTVEHGLAEAMVTMEHLSHVVGG